jgi:hypothetical protein
MEWGKDWLEPIQARLARSHPSLSRAELDDYDSACREAMKFGHAEVARIWTEVGNAENEAFVRFEAVIRERYPWISDNNVGRLFSQGTYYFMR